MRLKNYNRYGFSLVEVTLAVTVVGILASLSIGTWRRFIAEKHFEKTVYMMWKDLSTLRQEAMKNDYEYQVSFSSDSYTVTADSNKDGSFDDTLVCHVPERDMPEGVDITASIDPAMTGKNTSTDWISDTLVIKNDAVGSISEGYIYVVSKHPDDVIYLMVCEGSSNQIKFRVYKGGSWRDIS